VGITTPLQDFKTLYIAVAEPVAVSGPRGLLQFALERLSEYAGLVAGL
jgi:hypothetical protein